MSPPAYDVADMLRDDLADGRAAWLEDAPTPQDRDAQRKTSFLLSPDDAGHVVDFHSLRHTTGSLLAAAQVHPKVAQSIMRHSSIELTMSRYTHVFAGQEADAVAALPDLGAAPVKESGKLEATNNRQAVLSLCLALPGSFSRVSSRGPATKDGKRDSGETPENKGESRDSRQDSPLREPGLEPGTYALKVRCSTN